MKLTVQTMIHGFGNRKCLMMSMVTTIVFISNSAYFSIRINRSFFKKKIDWVALDALEKSTLK